MDQWFTETLHDHYRQLFHIQNLIHEEQTHHQKLVIFKNEIFGTVLALDGVIQTTERDEFGYHEMMTHVPILAHGNVKKVLIIGGGDGGILREVLKHTTVEQVTLVELDSSVINISQKYLNAAFDDPRVQIVICNGQDFLSSVGTAQDVIICDSTDPIGPGATLFTSEFYGNCQKMLTPAGILVNQNGVPFFQMQELCDSLKHRTPHFTDVGFYLTVVPSYVGGFMAIGWATNQTSYRDISVEELHQRLHQIQGNLKYYTPEIHKAAFVLPKFIGDALKS